MILLTYYSYVVMIHSFTFIFSLAVTVHFNRPFMRVEEQGIAQLTLVKDEASDIPVDVMLSTMDGSANGKILCYLFFQLISNIHSCHIIIIWRCHIIVILANFDSM